MKGRENRAYAQTQPSEKTVSFTSFTRARGELMKNEIGFVNTCMDTLLREEDFRGQFILSRPVL